MYEGYEYKCERGIRVCVNGIRVQVCLKGKQVCVHVIGITGWNKSVPVCVSGIIYSIVYEYM